MGVVRTDNWLDEFFDQPEKLCEKTNPNEKNIRSFYKYLQYFGMYHPSKASKEVFNKLKDQKAWEIFNELFVKYRKKWEGPNIPIYIFPINGNNSSLMRETKGKSGVSFNDKMFLFISPVEDKKEWEALFVHEYNHVTRMSKMSKNPFEYTLLDSMVLEGLAEHAVQEYCGEKYVARWSREYSDKQLKKVWNNDIKSRLTITKKNPLHDDLLFGRKLVPRMVGYALGYKIISEYRERYYFSVNDDIKTSSEKFLMKQFLE